MKKYIITETRPATLHWIFEVKAENEEEALHKVMDGDAGDDIIEHWTEESEEDSEYDIEESDDE